MNKVQPSSDLAGSIADQYKLYFSPDNKAVKSADDAKFEIFSLLDQLSNSSSSDSTSCDMS